MGFLLDLIDVNEAVNYTFVIYCMAGYILLFWLAVSTWVAKDSYKRYEQNTFAAVVWFLIALLLNFPGFMFYLIVRPEETDQNTYFGGGVNVPIANFVDKQGDFVMGIQLKINNTELVEQVRDMSLSIDWESRDRKKEITSEAIATQITDVNKKVINLSRVMAAFGNRLQKIRDIRKASIKENTPMLEADEVKEIKEITEEPKESEKKEEVNSKKSKKHRKN